MRSLKWTTSHAVFVEEIDDGHKEIFQALDDLQKALAARTAAAELRTLVQRLKTCVVGHFAHEERLMRAARYGSLQWHQETHKVATRQVGRFAARLDQGEVEAASELLRYLSEWLHDHTRLQDTMMAAFLRNHRRLGKVTFSAGTKPFDSCKWVRADGEPLKVQVNESNE